MPDVAIPDMPRSPDVHAGGFLATAPDPYRYEGAHEFDPYEVSGMIGAAVPHGSRVLDVGCGTGKLSLQLREMRGASVVGIEPDADRAAMAAERGIETHTSTLDRLSVAQLGQFDVAVYADVLEHLPDPLSELLNVRPFVRPNGIVIVSVPNVAHWSVRLDLLRGRFRYARFGIMDATHLRWFTEETIRQVMGQAGLEVVSVQQTAGVQLLCYHEGRLSKIPEKRRSRMVRRLSRRYPRLFGCQHIVVGRFRDGAATA